MPTGSATTLQVDDALSFSALLELLDVSTRAGLSVTLKRSAPALIAEGSLNPDLIHKVVVSHKAKVRACFDQVLTSFSKLDGKAVLKLTIAADGTVSTAVAESTSNTELSNCIAERVKTWVFPKPKGGGVVITTYPFKLSAK